jgi:FAD/FMN-containing dehydrogenase
MDRMTDFKRRVADMLKGEITDAQADRRKMSRDTSIFQIMPSFVAYPKDARDVATLVKEVRAARREGFNLSLTGRSAGTDMTGGPLTSSIVVSFTKYMNRTGDVSAARASAEPGVYYRDFEKETLKCGAIMPSYPASREICAIGGMVNNNAGGEKTLFYGKTADYVESVDVVLSDGTETRFEELSPQALEEKKKLQTLEGDIYCRMHALIEGNRDEIARAKPKVTKNSAGYALWRVENPKTGGFNLAQLIVGSQGTLALTTKATFRLVRPKEHRSMLVIFCSDLSILPDVVHKVLAHKPESFESYDDHTFSLAVRFLPQMLKSMGLRKALRLGIAFLPEVGMVLRGGVPKLVLMAEFAEDSDTAARDKAHAAREALSGLSVRTRIAKSEAEAEKYWITRRESFSLLRKNLKGLYAAPFIDDIIIPVDAYPEFIPELTRVLSEHALVYTIAGHIGDGNFHIIPLMDMKRDDVHAEIETLTPKVYELTTRFGGSITAEHNDGIIRTPYLFMMFSPTMLELFSEVKRIFDPDDIFNPKKKVNGAASDIKRYMIRKV